MNQFVSPAVAENLATLHALEYFEARAERGSREKLLAVLDKAPGVEPEEDDAL